MASISLYKMKFCPKCGKKGIKGDFCSKCYEEIINSMLEFKEIHIKVCPLCMTYFFQNRQVRFDDIATVIRKVAKQNIKKNLHAEIKPILPQIEFKPGRKYSFEVEVALSPKEKYYLPAVLEMVRCRKCDRQGTKYYEGILQLRNTTKEVIDFVRNDIKKHSSKGVFITKERKSGNSIDMWITSQRYLQNLGKRLHKRFGGILKISPRIYSRDRQTSRDVFRVNVYFEMLGYNTGDIVKTDNKLIKVTSTGKHVTGVNIKTGKRTSFASKDDVKVLEKRKAEVVKDYPEIEIMDPDTYQPVKVENTKKIKAGEWVDVIVDEGKYYIV
ncbi:hypothetical protein GF345_03510 [Candidatus Woesearchaeota archaeon]|nr:hypothetical protein [Candidatus Woesearchaeota archaeon]